MPRAAHPAPGPAALHWFKSSHSKGDGGACVEVAAHPSAVHTRDSKVTDGPVLTVGPAAWNAFIQGGSTAL
ncbi:DUF397 domain-containing protein [Streptomyces microflavus]|uniref:DUF397 domain-containing protein n=1 Tax=Streptomyces TaxID=1883 RepID=UPI000B915482|nr:MULTISPECIES: DUF397 domain-containing protein [Streptomyces]OXY88445.1 DUF397 domain-containing protein [Streptomyces sp. 2R]WSR94164.1 DUF397 domain-containing protein [Streptomyces microflavus]